jgi:Major Facilitator Superfamily
LALQTLVVVTLRGGPIEVGWLNAARWLPYLVFGLVVGALVDRIRRRPVMVTTDLTRAVVLAVIPVAWLLDVLTFPLLLFVVLAFGTVSLVNDAASMSFVPRLVPRTQLQRAHARLDGADAVAQTAGPAVAGALIRIVGAPLAVLVDAVTYLFSAAMVATLRNVSEPTPSHPTKLHVRALAPRRRTVGLRRIGARPVGGSDSYLVRRPGGAAGRGCSLQLPAARSVGVPAGTGVRIRWCRRTCWGRAEYQGRRQPRYRRGDHLHLRRLQHRRRRHADRGIRTCRMGGCSRARHGTVRAHGWGMGVGNSHEISYRQALTPDGLQARTNTTMRSLNRAVIVIVSPLAGVAAYRLGYTPALAAAATVFAISALILAISPFRRARIS